MLKCPADLVNVIAVVTLYKGPYSYKDRLTVQPYTLHNSGPSTMNRLLNYLNNGWQVTLDEWFMWLNRIHIK